MGKSNVVTIRKLNGNRRSGGLCIDDREINGGVIARTTGISNERDGGTSKQCR